MNFCSTNGKGSVLIAYNYLKAQHLFVKMREQAFPEMVEDFDDEHQMVVFGNYQLMKKMKVDRQDKNAFPSIVYRNFANTLSIVDIEIREA